MKQNYLLLTAFICILGNTNAQSPNWLWANSPGGTGDENAYAISTDASGNVYVTGYFKDSSITFGTTTLTNIANKDMFIVKYDASGNVLWAKSAGGFDEESGFAISIDAAGNVYVTGYFYSPLITFGATTLHNVLHHDMFIVKYDSSGTALWAKAVGGTNSEYGRGISTDAAGNVYVTGWFYSSTITFGTTTLTNVGPAWTNEIFIVKYDSSGTVLWAKSAGGTSAESGLGITTDASGNVYATGIFTSPSITFGTDTLTNSGNGDIFIAKYDSSGTVLWANSAGGTDGDTGQSISTDTEGNVYVTGFFRSDSITFGTTTLINSGLAGGGFADMFIVKYNASGTVLWAKSAGGTDYDAGYCISSSADGNLYLTGIFASSSVTFGTTTLTNAGGEDIFIAKYDSSGTVLWAKSVGGTANDNGWGICTDAAGNAYVAGDFNSSSITFGTTTLTNVAGHDMFVAKLASTITGIEENIEQQGMNIFPNPAGNSFSITFGNNTKVEIAIIDLTGKIIYRTSANDPDNTNSPDSYRDRDREQKIEVNTKDFAAGIYVVRIEATDYLKTKKLIVVK